MFNHKNKVYVHWDTIRFLKESNIKEDNCITLSYLINGKYYDLMVYIIKEQEKYDVYVYRSTKEDDFDKFSFGDFYEARDFVSNLAYTHPEYRQRPYKVVNK